MAQRRSVHCLIAAGGTAGHVAPSLAVAEALERRGARVTFAGSPDRVEARLVPEAGYELDTFRISGLPRRPSLELVRAVLLAGGAAPAGGGPPAPPQPPPGVRGGGPRAGGGGALPGRPQPRRGAGGRRLRRGSDGLRGPPPQDPDCADGSRCAPRSREQARRAIRAAHLSLVPDPRA